MKTVAVVCLVAAVLASAAAAYDFPLSYCAANMSVNPWLATTAEKDGFELALVQLVFRHGDRVPVVGLHDNDPVWDCELNMVDKPSVGDSEVGNLDERLFRFAQLYNRNVLPGNCSLGQLTEIGHTQHNIIGSHFRELYHDTYGFLPSEYNARDVWVRAINIPRCRQSAQSEIEGIFPDVAARKAAGGEPYEIVPVYTMDPNTENMSPNFAACPNLLPKIAAQQQSPAWAAFNAETKAMTDDILSLLGYSSASEVGSTQYPFYIGIFDDFACRNCHSLPMVKGVDKALFDAVVDAGTWTVNNWLFNETMASIGVGTFFGELLAAMDQVVGAGSAYDGPILRLYGGQDLTIGPLLNCLGMYDGVWPPYAAHLSLELWTDASGAYFVRVLYNGEVRTVPNCAEFCPYAAFTAAVSHMALTPAQYAAQCGVSGKRPAFTPGMVNAAMFM